MRLFRGKGEHSVNELEEMLIAEAEAHIQTAGRLGQQLELARDVLERIQNANGSPEDEDYITTEAREGLLALK